MCYYQYPNHPPLLNVLYLFSTLLCSAHYISPFLILSPLHLSYCPFILTYSILLCSILFMLYSIHLSSTIIYASNLFTSPLYSSCHLFSSHLASTHHILFSTLLSSPLLSSPILYRLTYEWRSALSSAEAVTYSVTFPDIRGTTRQLNKGNKIT